MSLDLQGGCLPKPSITPVVSRGRRDTWRDRQTAATPQRGMHGEGRGVLSGY